MHLNILPNVKCYKEELYFLNSSLWLINVFILMSAFQTLHYQNNYSERYIDSPEIITYWIFTNC